MHATGQYEFSFAIGAMYTLLTNQREGSSASANFLQHQCFPHAGLSSSLRHDVLMVIIWVVGNNSIFCHHPTASSDT